MELSKQIISDFTIINIGTRNNLKFTKKNTSNILHLENLHFNNKLICAYLRKTEYDVRLVAYQPLCRQRIILMVIWHFVLFPN